MRSERRFTAAQIRRKLQAVRNLAARPGTDAEGELARKMISRLEAAAKAAVRAPRGAARKSAGPRDKAEAMAIFYALQKKGYQVERFKNAAGEWAYRIVEPDSKKARVIAMLRRPRGATLANIMRETGWQAHTVRGFIAGTVKGLGYRVESYRNDAGERTYRIRI